MCFVTLIMVLFNAPVYVCPAFFFCFSLDCALHDPHVYFSVAENLLNFLNDYAYPECQMFSYFSV